MVLVKIAIFKREKSLNLLPNLHSTFECRTTVHFSAFARKLYSNFHFRKNRFLLLKGENF